MESAESYVAPEEVPTFVSQPGTLPNEELTSRLVPGYDEVFNLDDGRVIRVLWDNPIAFRPDGTPVKSYEKPQIVGGWLYDSADELTAELDARENYDPDEHPPIDMFQVAFASGGEFAERIPELAKQLPDVLGIPADRLDFSTESLTDVEMAVRRLGGEKALENSNFLPLIAYLAEVMTRATGGHIEMLQNDDGGWEPVLCCGNKRDDETLPVTAVFLLEREEPWIDEYVLRAIHDANDKKANDTASDLMPLRHRFYRPIPDE